MITLIAALARNRAIGRGQALIWSSPEDMRRFKEATLGHVVLMGRKTWESLPEKFRPLPGRKNIVVSRQADYSAPGAAVAPSLAEALALAGEDEVFVIGGGDLYAQALPLAGRLLLTEVEADLPGDTFFPPFSAEQWQETGRISRDDAQGTRFDFVTYLRGGKDEA